jgi:hypothetical protein
MQTHVDDWFTIQQAAERCGLTVRQFRQKQTDHWRGLLNRPLHYREEPGHHGGYPRHHFRVADIDHLAALLRQQTGLAPGWIDEHTFRDATGEWLTDVGAREQFGLPVRSLRRWRKRRCRFNAGKVLTHRRVPAPCPERSRRGQGKVHVYLASELVRVAQVYHSNLDQSVYRDADGAVCLTCAQIVDHYEISPKLVQYWAAKPSRLHAGKALRWIEIIRSKRGNAGRALIRAYRQDDLERILHDEETVHKGTGRVSKRIHSNEREQRATQEVQAPPPNPPVPKKQTPSEPTPAQSSSTRRGGRPRSAPTQALYEACYVAYTHEKKLSIALRRVQREHPDKPPKDEATLRLYARRWALRNGLELKRPSY